MRFTSEIEVTLDEIAGSDEKICRMAAVSTGKDVSHERLKGLIGFLMRKKHGGPFEHGLLTFKVKAPAKCWWEHTRHRIGVSYSLRSSRWGKFDQPEIFVPEHARIQNGKSADPSIVDAPELDWSMKANLEIAAITAMKCYDKMLVDGVAPEVASYALPFNLMWEGYVTFNPRSLMKFLELRVNDPQAMFPSNPLREMHTISNGYARYFSEAYPATYGAFIERGRVAP